MDGEWKAALRLQIEALAKRNGLHRRNDADEPIRMRTQDMDSRIVKLRELVAMDASQAAQYYLECVCYADETERILNRTSSRSKHPLKKKAKDAILNNSVLPASPSAISSSQVEIATSTATVVAAGSDIGVPQRTRWWHIHRREDDYSEGKNQRRELWKNQKDFFLSCVGFMIGVGNTMRFPAKVYQHGGGVFFIPYFFCLLFFGLPIVMLHLSIGQYSGQSANVALKKMMPIASGLGWALVLIALPVAVYYNSLVSWALYYLWHSIKGLIDDETNGLPWDTCHSEWQLNMTCCDLHKLKRCLNSNTSITATEAFFYAEVLCVHSLDDFSLGPLQPHLVASLAAAWLLVFIGVCKGIGSIGWSMNFTATLPYLLLTILLLRGVSLPGASKGLTFLFSINTSRIWSWEMWKSAAEQVFYELGIDAAPLISMAAFSRFRNNVYRDSIALVLIDAMTSTLAAMVEFSFVGFLASVSDGNVDDVLKHDPLYLSFTVYPGVTSFMQWGSLWASLFFSMLVLAAIDAEFAWLEMIASAMMSYFSTKNKSFENRLLAGLCLGGFIFGLPLCAQGGIFLFHAIENLNANWNSFSLALLTLIVVCYGYGTEKFLRDISNMLRIPQYTSRSSRFKHKLAYIFGPNGLYIRFSWTIFCPLILSLLLGASVFGYRRITFAAIEIPLIYELIAWLVMVGPLLVIPAVALFQIRQNWMEGKTTRSLFDSNNWCQDDAAKEQCEFVERRSVRPSTRRVPNRENTYMYIDAISRGPTISRSRVHPMEEYGWRTGRLRDWQIEQDRPSSVTSFNSPSTDSQKSTLGGGDIALFGSPPVSNAFLISDAATIRTRSNYQSNNAAEKKDEDILNIPKDKDRYEKRKFESEPPIPASPIPRKHSPCRSEPPICQSEPPTISIRSLSESEVEGSSNSDDDSASERDGRPQRVTIVRRIASQDSCVAASTGSISITPVDIQRQRSISSVAIYDDKKPRLGGGRVLSQLKRPAPIDAPGSSK